MVRQVTSFTLYSERNFLITALISILLIFIGLGLFNFHNDRWGIYSKDSLYFADGVQPNRLALKTWHILKHPEAYECLVMGSSRVEMIDTNNMPDNCYNFTHSAGTPRNHKVALEKFIRAGIRFKSIYIGLDEASYLQSPTQGEEQNLRRTPADDFLKRIIFHSNYLLHFPQIRDWEIFNGFLPTTKNSWYVRYPEKHLVELREEADSFFAESEGNVKRLSTKQGVYWGETEFVDDAVEDLQAIASMSTEYEFSLTLFFNPLYYKTYLQQNTFIMERFLSGVVEYSNVLDFSGLNDYTLDDRYWHEASHYTTRLGDLLLPFIDSQQPLTPPFGRALSSNNVQQALSRKYRQDSNRLLQSSTFRGVNFIPARLAETIASRAKGEWKKYNLNEIELTNFEQHGSIYVSNGSGASLAFPGLCPEKGKALLLRLDVEFNKPEKLFIYKARANNNFGKQNRGRFFIPKGRQTVVAILRDFQCGSSIRLDSVAAKEYFKIYDIQTLEVSKRPQKNE
ncbi:MAG: hypothetical protein ACJAYC_003891 [Halieaceae bacterium]